MTPVSTDDLETAWRRVGFFLICLTIACVIQQLTGCASTSPASAPPCRAFDLSIPACAAIYSSELSECTALSSSRAASEQCENAVRAKYRRPPLDAGAK